MDNELCETLPIPGEGLHASRMPGHWLLARLGKRVLRPGGIELTRQLLTALHLHPADDVVEFAPGFGLTTRMALQSNPASYTAVERDHAAAGHVARLLQSPTRRWIHGSAEETSLPDACASVVFGEAMLTMQTTVHKRRIVAEAARLLKPGGRYGLHEICLTPDAISTDRKDEIEREMSQAVRVGVRPLTRAEWRVLLENEGFDVIDVRLLPFRLLEPIRLLQDEGLLGALRFVSRVARDAEARVRVLAMRRTIRKYSAHLSALSIVAIKRDPASAASAGAPANERSA